MSQTRDETARGTAYGFLAYVLWGVFPLYFRQLLPAGPWEIVAHRILWAFVVCALVIVLRRDLGFVRPLLADPRRALLVVLAGLAVGANWLIYVVAVNSGHTSEAALGYFLNPLVTIALGVLVLRETLRPLQWAAVAMGTAACLFLTIARGTVPWIALGLAVSFSGYSLLKNRLGPRLTAFRSLAAETTVLLPVAAMILVVVELQGRTTFGSGAGNSVWMASSGIVTAIPLLLFAAAAARVPLVTIGLLQFLTPVMQLLVAVFLLGEQVPTVRWFGFALVWVALALLTTDSVRAHRVRRRAARLGSASDGSDVAF
ncbi:EamA family transporter RarD [Brachybacterium sillae]|uniref:EamA family transporter RarD n=1 Tax=Brachybacterium sillae TaxID=2810536 RepID=UPI00217D2499|nr:EamA family transporter RarD [Brachybacterium sillae]